MENEEDVQHFFAVLESTADKAHRELTEQKTAELIQGIKGLREYHETILHLARRQAQRGGLEEMIDACNAADEIKEQGRGLEDVIAYLYGRLHKLRENTSPPAGPAEDTDAKYTWRKSVAG